MSPLYAPKYVEAPPVVPLPYGLLSVAQVVDDPDGRITMGMQYEPEACGQVYDTGGLCSPAPDFGTLTISVDDAGVATTDAAGFPDGDYEITWGGDGEASGSAGPDGAVFTYDGPGSYLVTVTGPDGYLATSNVTVTDGAATGPFDALIGFSKTAEDGIPLVSAEAITLFHLFTCRAPGGGWQAAVPRAQRALQLGEGRALEQVVATQLWAADDTVDLTPGEGAVHLVDGIALLEQYAAGLYGGRPVLHMGRDLGTKATTYGTVIRGAQDRLETVQGAYVAAGGGYVGLGAPGDGTAPDDGTAWIYVTGSVLVRRSTVIESTEVIETSSNQVSVLVERPYAVGWECVSAAVQVTTPYAVP